MSPSPIAPLKILTKNVSLSLPPIFSMVPLRSKGYSGIYWPKKVVFGLT